MSAAWIFHRGALGDSVLLWPRLRVLRAGGHAVMLVTDASKGKLAARELGIAHEDAERPRFHALWQEHAPIEAVRGVSLVIDHVGPKPCLGIQNTDLTEEPPSRWHENLARMFPGAAIESVLPPTGAEARALSAADSRAMPALRENAGGAIVMHVGAGSEAKRWAMERWVELGAALRSEGHTVELIAGEVEAERLSGRERAAFEGAGGRFLATLEALADVLGAARVFVGCDSGPTHLAAQLGVPTVALFGPTDPAVWGPAGPRVVVVAPESGRGMEWLSAGEVERGVRRVECR